MSKKLICEKKKYVPAEISDGMTNILAILFFVPYIMASIHTMFATKMLQEVLNLSFFAEITVVLMIFGTVEILFLRPNSKSPPFSPKSRVDGSSNS
ncbi:hypothetical protein ACT4UT_03020, partial [Bacillus sp. B-TM1]